MSIKSLLDELTPEDKRRLMYAFDNGFCQVVGLSDRRFVGVHCEHVVNLEIIERKGNWFCGYLLT